ncbi:hypothetical protein ALC56_13472 [Trachymyrmex septentrionalis]|uniref:Uncharacterized protein n=1 Tax=Trachymyrmex septentrionalis TaxID=34720 RepID=A0A195EW27_9HYME|nr:hypothetical protein ALC56_13472 [Trachymyrmex septentrionalis]
MATRANARHRSKRGKLCVWADMREHGQGDRRHTKMLQQQHRLPQQRCGSVYSCPTKYFMQVGEEKVFGRLCTEDIVYRLKSSGYQKLARYITKPIPSFSRPPQHLVRYVEEGKSDL